MRARTVPETSMSAHHGFVCSVEKAVHDQTFKNIIYSIGAGWTATEIAREASRWLGRPITNVQVSRRLPELEAKGLIERGRFSVMCPIKGRQMLAWFPKESIGESN